VTEPTILVTGATGTVGSAVVAALTDADAIVRAGVRTPDDGRSRVPEADEYVRFDFEKPETWGRAFEGATRLFLLIPPGEASVDRVTDAADAAVRSGVDHAAFLSVLGAGRNPLLPHRRVERHLEGSDAGATFLRASYFMQNLAEVHAEEIRTRGEIFVPAGDGRTSFVDARDVGAVAAAALVDGGRGTRAYDLTGPEALTYGEVAAIFTEVLGRPVEYADPSVVEFVRWTRARGEPLRFALAMVGIYATARFGFAGRVTNDVARALGRPPISMREFVADYREMWEASAGGVALS
jgi:uncharacterized protein YbjT (DUF2867 family)